MGVPEFITLEGIEGTGRTLQMETIVRWFRRHGHRVCTTSEPGGTNLGETVKTLITLPARDVITRDAEMLLLFAARAEHLTKVILPALARDEIVVCDRYSDTTYAYQCGGHGADPARIAALEGILPQHPQPGLTFWFDLPVQESLHRSAPTRFRNRYAQAGAAFYERARAVYAARHAEDPTRIQRIDAATDEADIARQVESILAARYTPEPAVQPG